MRKSIAFLVLAAFPLICAPLVAETEPATGIAVTFSLEPMEQSADSYIAIAKIRDADTNTVLSAPRIVFRKGAPAKLTTGLPNGDEIVLTVNVAESGNEASYEVKLIHGESTLSVQKATINLGN